MSIKNESQLNHAVIKSKQKELALQNQVNANSIGGITIPHSGKGQIIYMYPLIFIRQ